MKPTALFLFLLIIASSCTMEKRIHRPGWNVQWNKGFGHQQTLKNQEKRNQEISNLVVEQNLTSLQEYNDSAVIDVANPVENSLVVNGLRTLSDQHIRRSVRSKDDQIQSEIESVVKSDLPQERTKTNKELSVFFHKLMFVLVGLILIAVSIWLFYIAVQTSMVYLTILLIAGGVVLDLVGLFFVVIPFVINNFMP